jgi:hypothetical protein
VVHFIASVLCELHLQSFYPHTEDFDACIYQSLGEFCPLLGWPPTSTAMPLRRSIRLATLKRRASRPAGETS